MDFGRYYIYYQSKARKSNKIATHVLLPYTMSALMLGCRLERLEADSSSWLYTRRKK